LAALLMTALPMQGFAADGVFNLNAHASTLGGGFEIGSAVTENYSWRVGYNNFNISTEQNSGGLLYKGELQLSSLTALMDWRPWGGTAHVTAGLVFNNNKFDLQATTQPGTYSYNGVPYSSAGGDTMATLIEFKKYVPYLGVGLSGNPKRRGFSFNADLGVLFQGSPQAKVQTSGSWGGANPAQLAADAEAQLNSDLSRFKYYPVLSLGIGYTF